METIRAVVFDLYGTLIRIHTDEENLNRVWKPMTFYYGYHGAKYSSPDQLRRAYRSEVRRRQSVRRMHALAPAAARWRWNRCWKRCSEKKVRLG